jgi:hypothetical protein
MTASTFSRYVHLPAYPFRVFEDHLPCTVPENGEQDSYTVVSV